MTYSAPPHYPQVQAFAVNVQVVRGLNRSALEYRDEGLLYSLRNQEPYKELIEYSEETLR